MASDDPIHLLWRGAANYQLSYRGTRIMLDPLFTRLEGDKPHLEESADAVERIDYLLLTHGHLDHSWDVPYLVRRHRPIVYAPRACLADIGHERRDGMDRSELHALEQQKGIAVAIGDLRVTPYQIGREDIDWWFVRDMALRPFRHRQPRTLRYGVKWLTHHVLGNCFAFYFRFPSIGQSMLFFGNLTGDVSELDQVDGVDLLALPYCPANQQWVAQTEMLIRRFAARVVLVHHFDNFMNPFTRSEYIDLGLYRREILARCPNTELRFSKFGREVELDSL